MWRVGTAAAAALDMGSCDDTMPVMRASMSAMRMTGVRGNAGDHGRPPGRIWEARSYEYG